VGRRRRFDGLIIGVGVVHAAAEEFVLRAFDHSLPGRSSANDVSVECERVSVQLARMPDGVLDGKRVLPRRRRGRREKARGIVRA
jgi:hypothetical protein